MVKDFETFAAKLTGRLNKGEDVEDEDHPDDDNDNYILKKEAKAKVHEKLEILED